MAGATGLEPAASCVTGRGSNQLNYAPGYCHTHLAVALHAQPFPKLPWNAVTEKQKVVTN